MPINGISSDYSGRTIDLHIFQGVNPKELAVVTPSFGSISNYCTGIQKLIQRYAILLLTDIGSQVNFNDFGTDLMPTLSTSVSSLNKFDLIPIFNFANAKVLDEFKVYQRQTPDLPDDEQLNTSSLVDIQIINDSVSLIINLVPVAEPAVTFIIPLPV
jgi:hypothetical protein